MLRTLEAGDLPRLVEIGAEPGFNRWWPDLDEANLHEHLTGESGSVTFAVTVASDVVGIAQFYEENTPDYRHAGIDIGLETAAQGQGLGTDAVRTLARYLIDEGGHHRIVIDPAADNDRAIRCYEKVGFRPVGRLRRYERGADGTWHDGLLMDLLADELT